MKYKKLMMCAAALALMAGSAMANERVIYGGGNPETSTYSGVMVPHVVGVMATNGVGGYAWYGVTSGSGDNVLQVGFNPLGFAVGQSDVILAAIENGDPIKVYSANMGPECFHGISPNGVTFDQALSGGNPIYVGGEGSGGAWSIRNLIEDGYGIDPNTVNLVYEDAASAPAGAVGVFVQRPDPAAAKYKTLADAGFVFSGVDSIEAELAGYTPLDVTVRDSGVIAGLGASSQSFRTTCMTTVLFGHDPNALEAGSRDRRFLETLVIPRLEDVPASAWVPPSEGSWLGDMVASMNETVGTASADLAERGGSLLDRLNNL